MALILSHEEQEQVEALKGWWRENGRWVIAAVATALFVSLTWNGWRWWQSAQSQEAARHYAAVVQASAAKQWDEAKQAWQRLTAVPWVGKRQAPYAALTVAYAAARAGSWPVAEQLLTAALPLAEGEAAALVRQQAALVRLTQNDPQGALTLLDPPAPASFAPLIAEVRADAYAARGDGDAAKRAYSEALASAQDPMWRSILEAKRDQLRARSTD